MRKYEVYYEDVLLGILEINDEEKHKFIKNDSGVEQTKDKACHIKEILTGTEEFVDPIPFFLNRVRNGERLGIKVINYQTDKYVLKLVEN